MADIETTSPLASKCFEYRTIPGIGNSTASAPIRILPKHIPQTMTVDTLVELYGFGKWDDEPVWAKVDPETGKIPSYEQTKLAEDEVVKTAEVDICEDDVSGGTTELVEYFLNSWYKVAKAQQDVLADRKATQQWIRETRLTNTTATRSGVASTLGALNDSAPIHPPATPTKQVPPPMPTPSFAPAVSGGGAAAKVKIGTSLQNVFQFKKGKLEVVAPEDDCSEYDTDEFESKSVLTYDPETGEMVWECTEPSEGGGDASCDFCLVRISDPFRPIQQGKTTDGRSVTVILPSTL